MRLEPDNQASKAGLSLCTVFLVNINVKPYSRFDNILLRHINVNGMKTKQQNVSN